MWSPAQMDLLVVTLKRKNAKTKNYSNGNPFLLSSVLLTTNAPFVRVWKAHSAHLNGRLAEATDD